MVSFIDEHRAEYGVEPIGAQRPIAPSVYYEPKARQSSPERLPPRARREAAWSAEIQRGYAENFQGYGARQVWLPRNRAGLAVARCTVERLMRVLRLQGVRRGKGCRTTIPDGSADRAELVNRQVTATRPNQRWGADCTYVATWVGFVYVAFVIDGFARRLVGWRVARSMATELVLDALEQALGSRAAPQELVHHRDRGSQYLSIRYSERLAEVGVEPAVGSGGDSYDNALAETMIGLYKAEVIHHRGPWRNFDAVEYATLEWVDWYNNRRLLTSIGDIPPAEMEVAYHRQQRESAMGV